MGKQWKQWQTLLLLSLLLLLCSKITADGDWSHDTKRHLLLGRKVMTNLDNIKKQRHYFANKVVYDSLWPSWSVVHQAPLPMGFSRQEYWNGLPFVFQCMKVKSESDVAQSFLTPCDPMDCSLRGFSIHGIFQARALECVAISFSRGSTQPRDWNGSPTLQAETLPYDLPGKAIHKVNTIHKDKLKMD